MVIERRKFSPPQVARMWGVSTAKIIGWITSGQLRAINVSEGPKKRPRYLIDRADIQTFEAARAVVPAADSPTPTKRRRAATVKQYL
jgi:hypothetical protein